MKVAIVHDYLNQPGGAERLLGSIHRLFPDAPIYTTIASPAVIERWFPGADIRTSWLQRIPGITRHHRPFFMLYPSAIESFDLSEYDLVVSSSSAFGKGAITRPDACHVCYCNTPMRFGWSFDDYAAREKWSGITKAILPRLMGRLRAWDLRTANRPSMYVANSANVAARIEKVWSLPSVVVHPAVDVDRFTVSDSVGDYYLVVSRLIPYKRVDLAVEAFTANGKRLIVVGDGPGRRDLMAKAGPNVEFVGARPDAEVARLYAECRAFVFPGVEDFGMTPVEANAAGRPVIAFRAGGALETVVENETGVFFSEPTAASLVEAVSRVESIEWDAKRLRNHAERFAEPRFHRELTAAIELALRGEGPGQKPGASNQGLISRMIGLSGTVTAMELTEARVSLAAAEVSGE